MSKITGNKYGIEDAFRNCYYVVPDYQREYVWQEKQVTRLIDDIVEEMSDIGGTEYFVGTVIVSPMAENSNHFEVIDGQQRLTTFYLILCALRAFLKNEPQGTLIAELLSSSYTQRSGQISTNLKLEPRYEHSLEIVKKIVNVASDPQTVIKEINSLGIKRYGSLTNIINAYTTIYNYLSNSKSADDLIKFWGFLSHSVVFFQISTDISTALKIFETINERGVGLNPMDLLKNLLFRSVTSSDFNKLKTEWKKVTKPLEQRKEKPLRFLRYFIMSNYIVSNRERADFIVREDEIYGCFTAKENLKQTCYDDKPFDFVGKLQNYVSCYMNYLDGKDMNGNENTFMENLKELCGGAFSLHFILLLAAKDLPIDQFNKLVQSLENYLFYWIFAKRATKELERSFAKYAKELREISYIESKDELAENLTKFIESNLKIDESLEAELSAKLQSYTLDTMLKYRTKYLLMKIAQYVDMPFDATRIPGTLKLYKKLEIEHILPNNPEPELKNEFAIQNPNSNYDNYKTKLGNLTLFERALNIVAGNDWFGAKCKLYDKSRTYITTSIVKIITVGNESLVNKINENLIQFL